MFGMSMSLRPVVRMRCTPVPITTARTRVIEFFREPFGGAWLGEPGWLSAKQIAEGAEISEAKVRSVLRSKTFESRAVGRRKVYRIAPPIPVAPAREPFAGSHLQGRGEHVEEPQA